jgi:hypothetical protein
MIDVFGGEGHRVVLATFGPGQFTGGASMLGGSRALARLQARTAGRVIAPNTT